MLRRPGRSVAEFRAADVRFHLALVAAAGNEAMDLIMLAVRHTLQRRLAGELSTRADPGRTVEELTHEQEELLAAVRQGHPEPAAELAREHIEGFYGT